MRKISAALAMLSTLAAAMDRQALSSWYVGLNPDNVVYAINCGSNEQIQDLLGIVYERVSGGK
jgi:hypothetical protein